MPSRTRSVVLSPNALSREWNQFTFRRNDFTTQVADPPALLRQKAPADVPAGATRLVEKHVWSEIQPQRELYLAWRVLRRSSHSARCDLLDSGAPVRIRQSLHVENVEGIHVEAEVDPLRYREDFEERGIGRPVHGPIEDRMRERVERNIGAGNAWTRSISRLRSVSVGRGNVHRLTAEVFINIRRQLAFLYRWRAATQVGRGRIRCVVGGKAAYHRGQARGAGVAGDRGGRDIAVEPQVGLVAVAAAAIRNGMLMLVNLDRTGGP